MKRTITIILALTMLLSLASCGTGGSPDQSPAPTGKENADPAVDLRCSFATIISEQMLDVGNTIYYLCEGERMQLVYFTDKTNRGWMPLCGRPDCMHKYPDCCAYIDGGGDSFKIWAYGEHIYYIVLKSALIDTAPELWRMRLDGTEHEKLLQCSDDGLSGKYMDLQWDWLFHGRYAILTLVGRNSPDGAEASCAYFVIDLGADEPVQRRLGFEGYSALGYSVAGEGDILYGLTYPESGGAVVLRVDLKNGTSDELCTLPFVPGIYCCDIIGDRLYFCDGSSTGMIASVKTADGGMTLMDNRLPVGANYTIHGEYIISTTALSQSGSPGTRIYSLDGTLINEIPYEACGADITVTRAVGGLAFGVENLYDDPYAVYLFPPEWYLDLDEIGTEGFGWHRWSPDGE